MYAAKRCLDLSFFHRYRPAKTGEVDAKAYLTRTAPQKTLSAFAMELRAVLKTSGFGVAKKSSPLPRVPRSGGKGKKFPRQPWFP